MTARHIAAVGLWLLAWFSAGLGAAGIIPRGNRRRPAAWAGLAAGATAAGGLAWAGAALW